MSKKQRIKSPRAPEKPAVPSAPAPAPARHANLISLALICLLGILAYSNSFHGTFQFDDMRTIRFNFSLRDISNWKDIFLYERYRPLLMGSFALNYAIGGQDPYTYHVINLVLHIIAVFLFYLFCRKLHPDWRIAVLAAALMTLHPLNTESVSYISSRSIVLCSIFYFAGMLSYDDYLRNP